MFLNIILSFSEPWHQFDESLFIYYGQASILIPKSPSPFSFWLATSKCGIMLCNIWRIFEKKIYQKNFCNITFRTLDFLCCDSVDVGNVGKKRPELVAIGDLYVFDVSSTTFSIYFFIFNFLPCSSTCYLTFSESWHQIDRYVFIYNCQATILIPLSPSPFSSWLATSNGGIMLCAIWRICEKKDQNLLPYEIYMISMSPQLLSFIYIFIFNWLLYFSTYYLTFSDSWHKFNWSLFIYRTGDYPYPQKSFSFLILACYKQWRNYAVRNMENIWKKFLMLWFSWWR